MNHNEHKKYDRPAQKPVDKGWEQMRALLEREMPQKRRRPLLWILLPAAVALVLTVWQTGRNVHTPDPSPVSPPPPRPAAPASVEKPIAMQTLSADEQSDAPKGYAPPAEVPTALLWQTAPTLARPQSNAAAPEINGAFDFAEKSAGREHGHEPGEGQEHERALVTAQMPDAGPALPLPVAPPDVYSTTSHAPYSAIPLSTALANVATPDVRVALKRRLPLSAGVYVGSAVYPWNGNFTGRGGLQLQYAINNFLGLRVGAGISAYRISKNHLLTLPGNATFEAIENTVNSVNFSSSTAERYPAQIPLRWIYSIEAPLHAYVRINSRWEFVTGAMYQRDQSVRTASEILLANQILDLDVSSRYVRINNLAAQNVRLSRWVMHFGAGWNPTKRLNLSLYAQIPFSPIGMSRKGEADLPCLCMLSSDLASQKYENQYRLRPALFVQAAYRFTR